MKIFETIAHSKMKLCFFLLLTAAVNNASLAQNQITIESDTIQYELFVLKSKRKGKQKERRINPKRKIAIYMNDGQKYKGRYVLSSSNSIIIDNDTLLLSEITTLSAPMNKQRNAGAVWTGIASGIGTVAGVDFASDWGFVPGLVVGSILSAPFYAIGFPLIYVRKKHHIGDKWSLTIRKT